MSNTESPAPALVKEGAGLSVLVRLGEVYIIKRFSKSKREKAGRGPSPTVGWFNFQISEALNPI